jgi:hypothetical protein
MDVLIDSWNFWILGVLSMSRSVQRVWLILAKLTVVGINPANLTAGSEALVQCFVPQTALETALIDFSAPSLAVFTRHTCLEVAMNASWSVRPYTRGGSVSLA